MLLWLSRMMHDGTSSLSLSSRESQSRLLFGQSVVEAESIVDLWKNTSATKSCTVALPGSLGGDKDKTQIFLWLPKVRPGRYYYCKIIVWFEGQIQSCTQEWEKVKSKLKDYKTGKKCLYKPTKSEPRERNAQRRWHQSESTNALALILHHQPP